MTKIEWCDKTVNPVVGCTYGCDYCYARKMNQRFKWIKDFDEPQFFHHRLQRLYTKEPKVIFINSMSDIADWKGSWLMEVMVAIENNPQNTYLALSKRPHWITDDVYDFKPNNLYIGQTITQMMSHYKKLGLIYNRVDFLSIEPLLGPIKLDLSGTNVKWVIIGAETGNRKGKVIPEPEWVGYILEECIKNKIPVFMKSSMIPIVGDYMCSQSRWPDFITKRHPEKGQK